MPHAVPSRDELPPPLRFLAGGGEATRLILARDWRGHPLGRPETWPEALGFLTPPFEMYRTFEGKDWGELLAGVDEEFQGLIKNILQYESSKRPSAAQVRMFFL